MLTILHYHNSHGVRCIESCLQIFQHGPYRNQVSPARGFPKIKDTFLGGPYNEDENMLGLYWVPQISGNYHGTLYKVPFKLRHPQHSRSEAPAICCFQTITGLGCRV